MAQANYVKFNKRVRNIERTHRKISRGYVELVERDGLLVPRSRSVLHRKFPLRGLGIAFALFLAFKVVLLLQLGQATYETRVEKLNTGTAIEQVGGWVMSADPISLWLATQVKQLSHMI